MATDATGTVVWAASYLPFGGIREVLVDAGVVGQDIRFPGQWFQAETGLHQNWHRDYDPTTGRYLQVDPFSLIDGPSLYGYARQNPLRWTDPTGEFIPIIACLGGAAVGAGGALAGFTFGTVIAVGMNPPTDVPRTSCEVEQRLVNQMIAGAISGCIAGVTSSLATPAMVVTLGITFASGALTGATQEIY